MCVLYSILLYILSISLAEEVADGTSRSLTAVAQAGTALQLLIRLKAKTGGSCFIYLDSAFGCSFHCPALGAGISVERGYSCARAKEQLPSRNSSS